MGKYAEKIGSRQPADAQDLTSENAAGKVRKKSTPLPASKHQQQPEHRQLSLLSHLTQKEEISHLSQKESNQFVNSTPDGAGILNR